MCLGTWSKLDLVQNTDINTVEILLDIIGEEDELELGWDYILYD